MSFIDTTVTKCYALHSVDGEIFSILSGSADAITLNTPVDQFATEVAITVEGPTHYIDVLADPMVAVAKGPQPTKYHVFNYTSYTWVTPQGPEEVRVDKRAAIEAEFVRRVYATIQYDNKTLDADFTAQFNLSSKLAELNARGSGEGIPANQLVWRDADNITYTFADYTTFKAWLNNLIIAISERATASYIWSWQKKEDLALLTTYAEIFAFDPIS